MSTVLCGFPLKYGFIIVHVHLYIGVHYMYTCTYLQPKSACTYMYMHVYISPLNQARYLPNPVVLRKCSVVRSLTTYDVTSLIVDSLCII